MGDEIDRVCGKVTSLRRAGRLGAARALARRELNLNPGDERISRVLSWVICDHIRALSDLPASEFDPSRLAADLRDLAALRLPEKGNDVLYRNLVRRLTSLSWNLRRAGDDGALRACLRVLMESLRISSDAEWIAKGSPRSSGRTIELCAREAQELLRPFLSVLGASSEDLSQLVEWTGAAPFANVEELRHGKWDFIGERGGVGGAAASLPKTSFYVEWVSERHGSVGITTFRRAAAREYGAPAVSIERRVVRDPRLACTLKAHEVYDAVLSLDGRSILGSPTRCLDDSIRSTFVREFEGRIDLVGDYGFVRIPGGTAARNDILIPSRLVSGSGIPSLANVSGTAVAEFREGREGEEGSWGFVADKVSRVSLPSPGEVRRTIGGMLRQTRSGACFVGDCLVPAAMAERAGLIEGARVKVTAELRWDRRRRAWSWIAAAIRVLGGCGRGERNDGRRAVGDAGAEG